MTLGDRLRRAREQKGFTQVGVSRKLGINNKTLSGYEKNIGTPSPETLAKLADLYEVSIDYLVKGEHVIVTNNDELELDEILDQFKQQLAKRNLTDEDKKKILDTVSEVFWNVKNSPK